jgi:deoxyribodipyrimidine photo-lyase
MAPPSLVWLGQDMRSFVPKRAGLATKWIRDPLAAPGQVRRAAGIDLGRTYPSPIVAHKQARSRAFAAFEATREPA